MIFPITISILLGVLVFVFYCNIKIRQTTENDIYNNTEQLPKRTYGLVLGVTPARLREDVISPILDNRINAAYQLYQEKKVDHFILSGYDNRKNYNEAEVIREALIQKGIPPSALQTDSNSFRTYDSIFFCKETLGLESIIVISQKFHNYRALYIAKKIGLKAIAYNAKTVYDINIYYFRIREYIARCKTILDLWN